VRCRFDFSNDEEVDLQLSELMGFSDSSTFHRAFKKWTGLTPQDYKQQPC